MLTKPFENPVLNKMEIFNEICIIVVGYHLILFTDYAPDEDTQYKGGWSIIGITVLNIVVNMGVMMVFTVRKIKLKFKRFRQKFTILKIKLM